MKFLIVLCGLLVSACIVRSEVALKSKPLPASRPLLRNDLQKRHYTVRLDHFSPQDNRLVDFTYVQNLDLYRPGGPIFVYINDNDMFTDEFLVMGLMHDIAAEAGAALITANNRFFRSNLPTDNASTSNLRYLTVEQTIYDIGYLINAAKANINAPAARVILWGTGQGATLATWTKQKLPHLVDGVWSSSGIYQNSVHTPESFESLSRSIKEIGGIKCATSVRKAFDTMLHLMQIEEYRTLTDKLRMCSRPVYAEDQAAFFSGIVKMMIDFVNTYHYQGILHFCDDMAGPVPNDTDESRREFEAFTQWISHIINKEICLDVAFFSRVYEASFVEWEDIKELAWNKSLNIVYPFVSRPLFYLHCTQLGLFATNMDADSLFGNLTGGDFYRDGCSRVFNVPEVDFDFELLTKAVKKLQDQFGGKNPGVSNVIYTNGQLDTHYAFGITDAVELSSDVYVRSISYHGKSADLWSISECDPKELRDVKQEIKQLILKWSGVTSIATH